MKAVKHTVDLPGVPKGTTALMREDGRVQLDGPPDLWRGEQHHYPLCFGWHDLGDQWEEIPIDER